jgi:hypothetical protein
MPTQPFSFDSSFIPTEPVSRSSEELSRDAGMLDGQEVEVEGWNGVLELVAADLYRIGSMLLGEGEDTIGLIEEAVATADIPSCSGQAEARHSGRLALAAGAIARVTARTPGALLAPEGEAGPVSCIEDDDLSAAGLTENELQQMLAGEERGRLRAWLEGLSEPLRVVFVLRGVAGLSSAEVAGLLAEHGGTGAEDWNPEAVRSSFRQALCSLASQLLHASAAK